MESKMTPDCATSVPILFRRCHSFMADPETTTQEETSPSIYRRGMIAGMAAVASGSMAGCSLLGGDSNDGSDDSTSGTADTGGTDGTGNPGGGSVIERDGAEDLTVSPITTYPSELILGLDDVPDTPAGSSEGEWRYEGQRTHHEDDLFYFANSPDTPALQTTNSMQFIDTEINSTVLLDSSTIIFESPDAAESAYEQTRSNHESHDFSGGGSYEQLEYGNVSHLILTEGSEDWTALIVMQMENIVTIINYINRIQVEEELTRSEAINYHEMQLERINNEIDI